MKVNKISLPSVRSLLVAATALLALVACGGGGTAAPAPDDGGGGGDTGGDAGGGNDTGGIDRGGVAIGVISGFGSVIVNGVRYDTDTAQFVIDDEVGAESDLAVGFRVLVAGTQNDDGDGIAERVEYEADLEGPIEQIDLATSTLQVLGQVVEIRNDTFFDDDLVPASIDALMVGDFVEVSGFSGADGFLVATRIEVEDDPDDFEVTGVLRNLDPVAQTFTIGGLTVDFSMAMLEDFPGGELVEGLRVEAEGNALGANGELIAQRVENEEADDDREEGDFAEIEGLISAFESPERFTVAGTTVVTTADTTFEGGSAADLALNVRVEVDGDFDSEGVLIAEEVEIDSAYNLELEGPVEAVDLTANTLTVLGLTITVLADTYFEDDSEAELIAFGLADLRVGDFVEITASQDDETGEIIARSVERDDDDGENEVALQGFIEAIDSVAGVITVLGIDIIADPDDTEDFDEVLAVAMVGDLIEAEGSLLAEGVLQADEIEFESPEDNDGDDDDDDDDDDDE